MSQWIADVSYAWDEMTSAKLKELGAVGVIGYAGCEDTAKNVGKARFEDWANSGLWVALVIENSGTSLLGGKAVGESQGSALVNAARNLGYDVDHCVLFASADWNSQSGSDLEAIQQAMVGFDSYVPVPGLYGNSYALNLENLEGWQDSSDSFSNGLSGAAQLKQNYNDPRAGGNQIDVNDVIKQPLHFMGETMSQPTNPEIEADVKAELDTGTGQGEPDWASTNKAELATTEGLVNKENQELGNESTILAAITTLQNTANAILAAVEALNNSQSGSAAGTYSGTLTLTKSGS